MRNRRMWGALSALVIASTITPITGAGAAAPKVGMLRVTTSPAVPSQISVDGTLRDNWGLNWMKITPGLHEVCFADVPGYAAPACQTVNVFEGVTTTVNGAFTQNGYLKVNTSPASPSQISVDGIPRDNWGLYTDLAPGSHQVCFGAVAGRTPPPCQTVTVTAGATTEVTGTFTTNGSASGLPGVGMLRVTTSPAVPSQISVDGVAANTWGLNWLEITPGSHQVCFSDIRGYTTPACQTATVTAGATTEVIGAFTQRGYLKAVTAPPRSATITIDDVPRNDWGVYVDLPTGPHTICFGEVAGVARPSCTSGAVVAGTTTTFTGNGVTPSVPVAPTAAVASAGHGSASVKWTASTDDGGNSITGYTVTSNPGAKTCTTDGVLVCEVKGLTAGTSYTFTVKATNPMGSSNPSAPSNAVTPLGSGTINPLALADVPTVMTPEAISPNGTWIVGTAATTGVIYDGMSMATVPAPSGASSTLLEGVTNTGMIVGSAAVPSLLPFVWTSPSATPTQLPLPAGYTFAKVDGMSTSGVVFGTGSDAGGTQRGLIWNSVNQAPAVLSFPSGSGVGSIVGVTNSGVIIGEVAGGFTINRGVTWANTASAPTYLQQASGYNGAKPTGVTPSGVVVGISQDNTGSVGRNRGTVWTSPSAAPTFVTVPAGQMNDATLIWGITDYQTIFGSTADANGEYTATTWTIGGTQPKKLDDSGALNSGMSIMAANVDLGVGYATFANETVKRFTWTPGYSYYVQSVLPTAPAPLKSAWVSGISATGVSVGMGRRRDSSQIAVAWASPAATPTVITGPTGFGNIKVSGITASGVIYGLGTSPDGVVKPLSWASLGAEPTIWTAPNGMTVDSLRGMSASGHLVGRARGANFTTHMVWWDATTHAPTLLSVPPGFTNPRLDGISESGVAYGIGYAAGGPRMLVWTSPYTVDQVAQVPSETDGVSPTGILPDGRIVAVHGLKSYVWASPSAAPVELTGLPGLIGLRAQAIGTDGSIVGVGTTQAGTNVIVKWASTTAPPTTVPLNLGPEAIATTAVSASGMIAFNDDIWTDPIPYVFVP